MVALDHVHETSERTLFELVMRPRLWRLSLGRHSRVYTETSVSEIVSDIFTRNSFSPHDFRIDLRGSYRPLPHVCQYRESDLAFISRWMERLGWTYYFEQAEQHERVVIVDDQKLHPQSRFVSVR